jgi:hypothetical protein
VKKLWGTLALSLILFATLFSYELNAAGTTTANCAGAGGQSQLGQYCGSTQSSQQGSDANSSLWKVWGGVSTVCITACMSGNPAGAQACSVSAKGGSVTQGVVTKNYASGLTSIAQSQGTSMVSSKINGASDKPQTDADGKPIEQSPEQKAAADKKKARNVACSGAATATAQAITNYRSMQTSSQAAAQTTKAAASLDSSATETIGGASSFANSRGTIGGSGKEGMSSAASAGGIASTCASARQTSNVAETIQCAVASDPTLPAIVTSGQLPAAFTKASGTAFSAFGSDPNQSPSDAIAQAVAGSLNTTDGLKVAALIKNMEGDLMNDDGGMYASAGGSGAGKSDEPENAAAQAELQDQLKDMMGKMQGAQEKADPGISAVIYANQNRSPVSVTEDKSLNIFDRVTYRYYFVVKQLRVENFK